MADDGANDDLADDNMEEPTEPTLDESNGVDSEAIGSPMLVLASRLQTGQKVLHVVSQESTHIAWNSVHNYTIILLKYAYGRPVERNNWLIYFPH